MHYFIFKGLMILMFSHYKTDDKYYWNKNMYDSNILFNLTAASNRRLISLFYTSKRIHM